LWKHITWTCPVTGFSLLDDDTSDDDEISDPHVGLLSSEQEKADFMQNRPDKRATKRAPKRKLGQQATKVSHLCGVNNLNAEHKAWMAVATANDGTYISTSFV